MNPLLELLHLLEKLVEKLNKLTDILKLADVPNISEYNALVQNEEDKLKRIIFIFDEAAQVFITLKKNQDKINEIIEKLEVIGTGRFAGIHIIFSTKTKC